jgi:hypothetical protein
MIDVVQEVFEQTIGHALKVDEVDLSTYTESFSYNVPDPGRWLPPAQNLDAMRTDVREDLSHLARDVTVTIPSTSEKGVTFTVIFLMDLPKVSKEPLGVDRLLEVLQSH